MKQQKTGKSLIIVESPTKIKTLKKFFGSEFVFESSYGHIRDLPQKGFGIDIEHNFEPEYAVVPGKQEIIDRLKKAAKQCDTVYLSPDPDREGEAIAWHICAILPKGTAVKRMTFHAITKEAVLQALKHPRDINIALVHAQQARRLLDRMVGYKISPILARRVQRDKQRGVSAGRVQSVALKLVVDREKAIEAFKPVEYWNIAALLQPETERNPFVANLFAVDGKKVEKEPIEGKDVFLISNAQVSQQIVERLKAARYHVGSVERKEKRRFPPPPFITSTLQQEASRHYGFSTERTMNVAQSLYEGVDLGNEGAEGLITYMRTDSVRVEPEAINAARKTISTQFGTDYLPDQPRHYSQAKAAQDAHEAIRPTNINRAPESVEAFLTRDQLLLYTLIWKRFLASQINPAIYDTVSADIETDKGLTLRATGSVIKFRGFLILYEEKHDEKDEADAEAEKLLPFLEEGQNLLLQEITHEQAFTRPPPRFTEASLVKELEKSGIGRPSTYATIMKKIQSREYTTKEGGRLRPTEIGRVIAEWLETNFAEIMNIGFTASMEDNLELVATNEKDWHELLKQFWEHFVPQLEVAEKQAFIPKVMTEIPCPKCGAPLQKIWSKSRYFYGCSRYPDCDFTSTAEELTFKKEEYNPSFDWAQPCPVCGSPMKIRHSRFGPFLGCTRYPECKGTVFIPKKDEVVLPAEELPACPAIGCDGKLMARRSRFGKTFYSCSNYPDCDVIVNDISQLEEKYANHPKTAYISKKKRFAKKGVAVPEKKRTPAKGKKAPKTKAKTPSKNVTLSPELAALVGERQMPRGEALKKLWDYIRTNNLQDPKNKRLINPDARLAKLFGSKASVDMFAMTKLLSKHFEK